MKPKILLINCSIRGVGSNCDLALNQIGAKHIQLNEYFLADGTKKNIPKLINKIKEADGLIFATPVYFGQGSSLLMDLVDFLYSCDVKNGLEYYSSSFNRLCRVDLFKKVVGFIAVGAKRNGGQETTITFLAWDFINMGAIVVNDGFPISQFGGVVVAGTKGKANNDKEGMEVCVHLGQRVYETAKILKAGNLRGKPKIKEWAMAGWDDNKKYERIKIFEMNFGRCLGHEICPNLKCNKDYKCYLNNDDISKIHKLLVESEGIYPVGFHYRFMERLRYLRRDNYRLTYSVVYIPDPRYIPYFIKQNSIICREHFEDYVKLISSGKKKLILTKQIYSPIGYEEILRCG